MSTPTNNLTGVNNAVTLITGASGSGKTSLLATLAEWLWKNHHKKLRLYTADGGGYGVRVQTLIQLGIIEVFRMRTRCTGDKEGMIEETCMRVSQGWWPKQVEPATGDVPPGVEMLPPQTTTYTVSCPNNHEVKKVGTRQAALTPTVCPQCKTNVTPANVKVVESTIVTPGFENVGAVAIEGLTSMSDWILMSLADRTGRNELGGEKPALGGIIRSGGMMFGSNNRSHYGFAQMQAEKWLLNSTAIPRLVVPPIWTGLESRVDENNLLPFYGPQIAGQARTGKVPQWVGNYLGCQVVTDEKGNKEWRLYLTEFRGEDGVPHKYKPRTDPGYLPDYLSDKKDGDGKPFTGFNLGLFFNLIDSAIQEERKRLMAEFPDAPGLPTSSDVQEQVSVAAEKPRQQPPAVPGIPAPKMPPRVPAAPGSK